MFPSYFLVNSLASIIGLIWLWPRSEQMKLSRILALETFLMLMITGLIGARLFHIFYEIPDYYLAHPVEVFYLWQGGFVFYGGALLGGICGYAYLRSKVSTQISSYLDLFAPIAALTYAIGRIGCLLAGCCYGKPTDLPWHLHHLHPTQIYSAGWEALLVLFLIWKEKRESLRPGRLFDLWVFYHSLGHFLIEFFRGDDRGPELWLSISGWISLALLLVFGWRLLWPRTTSLKPLHGVKARSQTKGKFKVTD